LRGVDTDAITLRRVLRLLGNQALQLDDAPAHQALYRQAAAAHWQIQREEYAAHQNRCGPARASTHHWVASAKVQAARQVREEESQDWGAAPGWKARQGMQPSEQLQKPLHKGKWLVSDWWLCGLFGSFIALR
jgi:hypothetical protein